MHSDLEEIKVTKYSNEHSYYMHLNAYHCLIFNYLEILHVIGYSEGKPTIMYCTCIHRMHW